MEHELCKKSNEHESLLLNDKSERNENETWHLFDLM